MAKYFSLQAVLATLQDSPGAACRLASVSREWEKAKATAIEKSIVDDIDALRERLDNEDRLSGGMADIGE